jgi:hypothetical protein
MQVCAQKNTIPNFVWALICEASDVRRLESWE